MTATAPSSVPTEPIDPITFEVIRHKLAAITEEQAITLKSVSGSPVVTDATDFNNGIYLADGSIVTMGPQVLFHTGTMSSVIRHIISDYSENPGIHEGDMFILNDPYRGAVHQPDISIVAPIFYRGEHIAWAGSCAHQLDVGGMNFGSWAVSATEVQQEAMLLPGIKIVEGNQVRADIWQMIMGMSRLPMVLGLDLKAMIAANNVAVRRLTEVIDRYGAAVVQDVMHGEIEASEARLRARLRQLPDGTFRAVDYLEHDGHQNLLYEVRVAVTKAGDELTFDFTGSSGQAPGFINCTRSGLIGAVFTALLPILAPDIRWNEGLLKPVTVEVPEGVIVNATWPAPVSSGTVSAVWVATNVSVAALSRLAACSASTSAESAAVTKGSMMVLTMAGVGRGNEPFGTFLLDSTAGGGGAYADHDGLNASGDYCVPRPSIANVESNEAGGPFLYLYRRLLSDTGGAGRMRGGSTVGLALTPHDTAELHAMLIGHGVEVPNSTGLFGGLEGSCNETVLRTGEDASPVGRITDEVTLRGPGGSVSDLGPKPGFFLLKAGDVLAYSFQGGGGYGDPLDRESERVRRDVEEGHVSPESAARLYGLVMEGAEVDVTGTAERREQLRRLRAADGPGGGDTPPAEGALEIGPSLRLLGHELSCRCGQALGPSDGDWKSTVATRVVEAPAHGAHVRLHDELELREHACPSCGTLLESEVARKDAPNLRSLQLSP